MKVLILDDSKISRSILEVWFESYNFEVYSCSNILDAKNIIKFCHFNVIVVDIYLDHECGYDFAEFLRINVLSPMVVLSLSADKIDNKMKFLFDDHIEKPFRDENLKTVLSRACDIFYERKEMLEFNKTSLKKSLFYETKKLLNDLIFQLENEDISQAIKNLHKIYGSYSLFDNDSDVYNLILDLKVSLSDKDRAKISYKEDIKTARKIICLLKDKL